MEEDDDAYKESERKSIYKLRLVLLYRFRGYSKPHVEVIPKHSTAETPPAFFSSSFYFCLPAELQTPILILFISFFSDPFSFSFVLISFSI